MGVDGSSQRLLAGSYTRFEPGSTATLTRAPPSLHDAGRSARSINIATFPFRNALRAASMSKASIPGGPHAFRATNFSSASTNGGVAIRGSIVSELKTSEY